MSLEEKAMQLKHSKRHIRQFIEYQRPDMAVTVEDGQ